MFLIPIGFSSLFVIFKFGTSTTPVEFLTLTSSGSIKLSNVRQREEIYYCEQFSIDGSVFLLLLQIVSEIFE
jgi:hypothetical protein